MRNNETEIVIVKTLNLPHCWLCKKPKEENVIFEQHHVVPRHLGGENGPTVTLCGVCHTTIHTIADQLIQSGKLPLLPYKKSKQRERCAYLATVICNATLAMENLNTENKRYVFSCFFDGKTHAKLVKLTKYFKMSQKKLIVYAINQLYARLFE